MRYEPLSRVQLAAPSEREVSTRARVSRQKKAFLVAFAVTGNVSAACRSAACDRRNVYRWLEHDERFSLEYRQAELSSEDVLEAAAFKRAVQGTQKQRGIYDRSGRRVETEVVTEYSDVLLMFLLKARNPAKYRERWGDGSPPAGDVERRYVGVPVDEV